MENVKMTIFVLFVALIMIPAAVVDSLGGSHLTVAIAAIMPTIIAIVCIIVVLNRKESQN